MAKKSTTSQPRKQKSSRARTKVRVAQAPGLSVWQLCLLSLTSLVAAYIFASLAIDSGSMWHYVLTIAAAYVLVKFVTQAFRTFRDERSK